MQKHWSFWLGLVIPGEVKTHQAHSWVCEFILSPGNLPSQEWVFLFLHLIASFPRRVFLKKLTATWLVCKYQSQLWVNTSQLGTSFAHQPATNAQTCQTKIWELKSPTGWSFSGFYETYFHLNFGEMKEVKVSTRYVKKATKENQKGKAGAHQRFFASFLENCFCKSWIKNLWACRT